MTKNIILSLFFAITICSCDNPQSIAWSYYYCAQDTLNAGAPYAAKSFLESCNTKADKTLAVKADSLMKEINKAINMKQATQ